MFITTQKANKYLIQMLPLFQNLEIIRLKAKVCKWKVTCIILWQHGSVDDTLKYSYPLFLFLFCLTGKEEFSVWCHNGDAKLPVVALRGGGQACYYGVATFLTTNEHFPSCIGILFRMLEWQRGKMGSRMQYPRL